MDASDLARFAQRDWSALAELKADYWASMKARSERVGSLLGSPEAALDRSDLRTLFEDQVQAAGKRKR